MPTLSESDIRHIRNLETLFDFLRDKLSWEIRDDLAPEDFFYDYTADELRLDKVTADKIQVRQIAPFVDEQPWGIFLVETNTPRVYTTHLRQILRALAPSARVQRPNQKAWRAENLLFVCVTPEYDSFTFAHFKGEKAATAKLASFGWDEQEIGLRTLREFNLPALEWYRGSDAREWIAKWTGAFDVSKVTNKFFQEYEELFDWIKNELRVARGVTQRLTAERRHFFTQRLMNRLLFLCFLQKKGWLDYNPRYLYDLYDRANEIGYNFYDDVLHHVLFLGLNRAAERAADGLSENELRARIGVLPFLNGGLFEYADEWDYYKKLDLSNEIFERILGPDGLLRRYNFTVTESTPLDVQVAIDPEMLGRVYEQLISERNKLGAFYTHPVEVRLMVREALKAFLAARAAFPDAPRGELLAAKIAALIDSERADAVNENEALDVYRALLDVKVCDLAIGSGAFPVAMMRELVEILRRLARTIAQGKLRYVVQDKLDDPESLYDLKLYVIQNCIFGADIDAFSVEIAKLRFWLSLVVDNPVHFENRADFERRVSEIPALPNLLYKIRVGDSVLAKVGKINWDVVEYKALKGAKKQKVKTARNMYDLMSLGALGKLQTLKQNYFLKTDVEKQKLQAEIDRAEMEFERALLLGQALPTDADKNKYILWQAHFAEVFGPGDPKGFQNPLGLEAALGFDIVIANPPYVRQELLDKDYKNELADTYEILFPDFHADKKSDLYVYFFLRALYLLKPRGVLCFICSNSWLDVGYGAPLQEMLLKHAHIRAIYDNSAKRSFQTADINTTINVFQRVAPQTALDNTARFVMFRQPFEDAATPENLQAIATANEIVSTDAYRVFPMKQEQLLEEGSEKDDSTGKVEYTGNKWNGKYLRGPDVFFVVLEKGKNKFVSLGDIAIVRFGIKSGANEFFHLDNDAIAEWNIEQEFLKPLIKSPRECKTIYVQPEGLKLKLLMCHKDKRELRGTNTLRYIQWGESQGFSERPSVKGRARWWDLGNWDYPEMLWSDAYNNRFACFEIAGEYYGDKRFFFINFRTKSAVARAFLNSTLIPLYIAVGGISNLGEGVIYTNVYWLKKISVLAKCGDEKALIQAYDKLKTREVKSIYDEVNMEDRRALDAIIFDALGLTQGERDGVYEAVVELVRKRLEKAGSV